MTDPGPRVGLEFADDGIGVLELRAPADNELAPETLDELVVAVDRFEAGGGRALVVASGLPGTFARGYDAARLRSLDGVAFVAHMHAMRAAFDRIDALPVPSIAAIDGTATGGGFELALACTFRVASTDATMGLPQVRLGIIPGAGGTQRLPRIVGQGRALDLLVTGRSVAGREAWEMGLVDRCARDGGALEEALALAAGVAAASGPAVRALRRTTAAARRSSFPQGMAVEAREALALFERGEAREGIAAYLDDRPPEFA